MQVIERKMDNIWEDLIHSYYGPCWVQIPDHNLSNECAKKEPVFRFLFDKECVVTFKGSC